MQVQPYLFFEGRAEEAAAFYKKAVGAEVTALMRYKENPEPEYNPPDSAEKVMHGSMKIGATDVMFSDGRNSGKPNFHGVSLSLTGLSAKDAEKAFAALSEGGQVQMPLGKTFFAERFGMVADKFGVSWMVVADPA